MPEPIAIEIKMLTPLWTGDVARRGSRVHETGILGSLRWWYEAIIRGVGRYACDPSSGSCVYEDKKGLESICLACQLFGCTGYGRRFRLVVEGEGDAGRPIEVKLKNPGTGNHRGWRIPPTVAGPITLTLYPMCPNGLGGFEKAALYHTLHLIECYGALGAKASHGQGVVKVTDWSILPGAIASDAWIKAMKERPAKDEENRRPSPNLLDFIGVTIMLDSSLTSEANWLNAIPITRINEFRLGSKPTWIPSAPAVRARLRSWLRSDANIPNFKGNLRNDRHRLMGTVQGGPKGSDIFVTHLYKADQRWSMRIFAFVPDDDNAVDQALRELLEDKKGLASEMQLAIGGLSVDVNPYPRNIVHLLAAGQGTQP